MDLTKSAMSSWNGGSGLDTERSPSEAGVWRWGDGISHRKMEILMGMRADRRDPPAREVRRKAKGKAEKSLVGDGGGQRESQEAVKPWEPSEAVNGQLCQMLLLTGLRGGCWVWKGQAAGLVAAGLFT